VIQTPNFDPNNRIEVYLAAILEELREHRKQATEMMKRAEEISDKPVRFVKMANKCRVMGTDTARLEYVMEHMFIVRDVGPRATRVYTTREDIDEAMAVDAPRASGAPGKG